MNYILIPHLQHLNQEKWFFIPGANVIKLVLDGLSPRFDLDYSIKEDEKKQHNMFASYNVYLVETKLYVYYPAYGVCCWCLDDQKTCQYESATENLNKPTFICLFKHCFCTYTHTPEPNTTLVSIASSFRSIVKSLSFSFATIKEWRSMKKKTFKPLPFTISIYFPWYCANMQNMKILVKWSYSHVVLVFGSQFFRYIWF